jgi:hypothetical protein
MIAELLLIGLGAGLGAGGLRLWQHFRLPRGDDFQVKYRKISSVTRVRWSRDDLKRWLQGLDDALKEVDDDTLVYIEYKYSVTGHYGSLDRSYWERQQLRLGQLKALEGNALPCGDRVTKARLYAVEYAQPKTHTLTEIDRRIIDELNNLEASRAPRRSPQTHTTHS